MKFKRIPDDLGPSGSVALFKRDFERVVWISRPGSTADEVWNELWQLFDREFPEVSDRELAVKIIDWFLRYSKAHFQNRNA
jgi:hypothetical protein